MTNIIPAIQAVAGFAYSVIEKDHDHYYGLLSPVDYGEIVTDRFAPFDYSDSFVIFRKLSEKSFNLILQPFDPSTRIWDGTSMLPDGGTRNLDALLKASVGHDVIYERAKAISEATGVPESALLAFADDLLKISADRYGCSKRFSKTVWNFLRIGGSLYHRIMGIFGTTAISVILAGFVGGCRLDSPENHTAILDPNPPEILYTGPYEK